VREISIIKERHVNWGITISAIISTVVYIITSIIGGGVIIYSGTVLYADLQFLVGSIIGVLYTLKNCQRDQSFLKYGIIVGMLGGFFTSMLISIYETLLLTLQGVGTLITFFLLLGFTLLSGVIIGLLVGAIIGTYYTYKEMKEETKVDKDDYIDDEFFEDLIDK
jgi:hypothetical protein